jgi:glycyl-tRNA synthetase beta subunit
MLRKLTPMAVAAAVVLMPTAALADFSTAQARTALAEARAKIEAASSGGAAERANEVLQRARASYAIAEREFRNDNENRTYHASKEAAAYAELALATAEYEAVQAQLRATSR